MTKEQWTAIKESDGSYDGVFYYGLKSTKKVHRPSCANRRNEPRGVVIFDTLQEALDRGYHPCTRCHPELPDWTNTKSELVRSTEEYIRQHYDEKFSLSALGEAMHVDKAYLARTFKSVTGQTLLEYHNLIRCEKAKELLTRPELSISHISSAIGYASASHFTQVFRKTAGFTPSEYRDDYFRKLNED